MGKISMILEILHPDNRLLGTTAEAVMRLDAARLTARTAGAVARRAAKRERAARGRRRESAQTREVGA